VTRNIRLTGLAAGVGLACLAFATPSRADVWNQSTLLTFNRPVALPGIALGSGTYRFELPDSNNRQLVRVTDQAGTRTYGLFMTVPAYRNDAAGSTIVSFKEASRRNPTPVQAWFYPGEQVGHQFLYTAASAKPAAKAAPHRTVRRHSTKKPVSK